MQPERSPTGTEDRQCSWKAARCVLKEPEPQGEVARARMMEVSGLPHPAGDVKYLMASTWDYSRLLELAGPQARDAVPQLAAQLVDVPNVDIPALQVVEEAEEVVYSQHALLLRFRDGE